MRLPMLQRQRDSQRGLNTAGFISGYRGSPLGGYDQALWSAKSFLDEHQIHFTPGVNEELAATAVRGSQEIEFLPSPKYDGVFGLWYGKGPGLDRAIDAIRHANAAGSSRFGGVLAVVGDDHACKSSSYPYQSEHVFASMSVPVLAPANVQEILDFGVLGWELSRFSGCWVGLKTVTENIDTAMLAEIDPDRMAVVLPDVPMPEGGVHVRLPDNPLSQEQRLNEYKIYAAREFAFANKLNKVVIDAPNAKYGIVASGKSYLDVLQALEDLGISENVAKSLGLRVYKVGMPWPLEPKQTQQFAEGLESIIVIEEKRSVIEDQLKGQLFDMASALRPTVFGEFDSKGNILLSNQGELNSALVAQAIGRWLGELDARLLIPSITERLNTIKQKQGDLIKPLNISGRAPMYCSGCPHNTSTQVPEGSIAGGGIGCHYMGLWSKSRPVHGFTQMGGEGVTYTGQAPFTNTAHIFQNLGDGTYFHSGILAIRQSVASKVNITYKILFNDAVAMTGGQPVDGSLAIADLVQQLKGEGVSRIELVSDQPAQHQRLADQWVTVSHRDDIISIQKSLRNTKGCSVLVYEQTCATETRRRRKRGKALDPARRIFINSAVCEGCGDCSVKSNCLSVLPKETEFGRKRQIDQAACNKDYSCANGFCPSFVSVVGGQLKKGRVVGEPDVFAGLEEPSYLASLEQPWNIVVTGVGGTGVLTLSAVLAMAAHIEGKGITSLNQTGLAQKFGPVASFIRIANNQQDIKAARIGLCNADLLLACDLVVGASNNVRACLSRPRSYAVVNETVAPTSEFVHDPDMILPEADMKAAIANELEQENVSFIPATELATGLLGDSLATNLFMLGVAYQKGLVPVSSSAINKALEMNGVKIEFNQQAFMWGRRAAIDEHKVAEASGLMEHRFERAEALDDIVALRVDSLTDYQNKSYAKDYLAVVEKVKAAELKLGELNLKLTKAVAKSLYKVMAYKDEYEVGRLYSNGEFAKQIAEQFEGDFHLEFHLAPPLLSKKDADTGHLIKRRFGAYMLPLYSVLAKMKFLRGTVWDIFGRTEERKMERGLISEQLDLIDQLLPMLTVDSIAQAVELIELVLSVRGFGHVKEANYRAYQLKRAALLSKFKGTEVEYIEL